MTQAIAGGGRSEAMNDPKPWYTSQTVWASVIGFVSAGLGMLGHHELASADINTLATDAAEVGGMAAGIIAIIGRYKASSPIAGTQAAAAIQPAQKG